MRKLRSLGILGSFGVGIAAIGLFAISLSVPVGAQPGGFGPPGGSADDASGPPSGGPFGDQLASLLAQNLTDQGYAETTDAVQAALQQAFADMPQPPGDGSGGPFGAGWPPAGGDWSPGDGPPQGVPPGGFFGGPGGGGDDGPGGSFRGRRPADANGGDEFPGGPGRFGPPGAPGGFSAPPGGAGVNALATSLSTSLDVPVDTVTAALQQTFEQMRANRPGGGEFWPDGPTEP